MNLMLLSVSYEIVFAEVQLLFDELRSLRDFYLQFLASYRQVGPELARRRRYELHIAQTVSDRSVIRRS